MLVNCILRLISFSLCLVPQVSRTNQFMPIQRYKWRGRTAVQCKHWKSWKVGVRNVRELIGAMTVEGLKKGAIVTIKGYSTEADDLARRHGIELVNEDGVLELLRLADQSSIQKILRDQRKICPKCELEMVLRTATKGLNARGQPHHHVL